jgi:2-polyprenyl-6-hydroxyphenyl methylase/3-demethylubiquinone-9 3-methyltransferase
MRVLADEEYCHERLGDRFERVLSGYDTRRRVEVLIDGFLTDAMLVGREVMDVGCGLGFFSRRLRDRGARVTGCDIGPKLLERTRQMAGCECQLADALALEQHFGPDRFDVVVSSECIEHTPDPLKALRQMAAVLRPGGHLVVSTPNLLWRPVVKLASWLRLRPFDGYENFISWGTMRRTLREAGLWIVREQGLHLLPFQLGLHGLSRWCDRHAQPLRGLMINICVLAQKEGRRPLSQAGGVEEVSGQARPRRSAA